MIGRRTRIIGRRQTLAITGSDEGHKLFCVVGASNSAGVTGAKFSNVYTVRGPPGQHRRAGRVRYVDSAPAPGTSPPANPGGLNGNTFNLSCGAGRWNRKDLTFSYTWVFDRRGSAQAPAQLTGLSVSGINLTLTINPPGGPLLVNGAPPQINGRVLYSLDYLDDTVQCLVTARAPNGLTGVALSPPVMLRGPVASL